MRSDGPAASAPPPLRQPRTSYLATAAHPILATQQHRLSHAGQEAAMEPSSCASARCSVRTLRHNAPMIVAGVGSDAD